MTTVASPDVDDLRHEMDANVSNLTGVRLRRKAGGGTVSKGADVKTSFLIRTLPRECNPTPVPTGLSASASGLLSPMADRRGGHADAEKRMFQQENPFDDITEEKLKQLSGSQELDQVSSLQISVDSSKQSVEVLGELLPSLQQLRLHQSTLSSFRDLGTSLRSLRILWAMHCQISDLDGIGALTNLQELYLQQNSVSDISPLTMHEELRVIDLKGNNVADMGQIEQLAFCPQLTALHLAGNPVESVEKCRQIIANFVPQLVSLDDKAFATSERIKLSDEEIDAAILKHRKALQTDGCAGTLLPSGITSLYEVGKSRQLSLSSSTASLSGLPADSSYNDDSGSRLTHGTDIVFAGNVSSSLRRHRCETEANNDLRNIVRIGNDEPTSDTDSRPSSRHGLSDRPKTPARRISITDTLDRAREIDAHKHKSRDAILDELKAWQLESAGASQVGVPRDANADFSQLNDSSSSSRSRRKGSVGDTTAATRAKLERRPNTSAGVLRNGINVREAFVDTVIGMNDGPTRPRSRGGPLQCGTSSFKSSTPGMEILILDGGNEDKRSHSPVKTSRGIFTTALAGEKALGRSREWNLEVLSSAVDITTAKHHIPSSLSSKQQRERSLARGARKVKGGSSGSSDSDSDDELSGCPVAAVESNSPTKVPKTAFFNVAESLNAIDKWRDEMEYDAEDTAILSVVSLQQSCLSPRPVAVASVETSSASNTDADRSTIGNQQQHSPVRPRQQNQKLSLGPANHDTDQHIFQLLREKHSQLKTREGFRAYFRGIEEARLERILGQVFEDHERVRRRMQLMSGLFQQKNCSAEHA